MWISNPLKVLQKATIVSTFETKHHIAKQQKCSFIPNWTFHENLCNFLTELLEEKTTEKFSCNLANDSHVN